MSSVVVYHEPVYTVRMSPAPVRVRVSMSSVDERVFERAAYVLGGQTGDRRHHVTRKLTDTQRLPVLTTPPIMLCPENTHIELHKTHTVIEFVSKSSAGKNKKMFLLSCWKNVHSAAKHTSMTFKIILCRV